MSAYAAERQRFVRSSLCHGLTLAVVLAGSVATTCSSAYASAAAATATPVTPLPPAIATTAAVYPATTVAPPPPDVWQVEALSAADLDALRRGELRTKSIGSGKREGVQALFWLPEPVTTVWNLFRDYPRYAEWLSGMESVDSVDWLDADTVVVGFTIASPLRPVSYRLLREHRAGPPEWAIRWARVDGDLEHINGGFHFYPVLGGTLVRYDTIVVLDRWIPDFVRRFFTERGLKALSEDVRSAAAAYAAAP